MPEIESATKAGAGVEVGPARPEAAAARATLSGLRPPPGPGPFALARAVLRSGGHRSRVLESLFEVYGELVQFSVGRHRLVVTSSVEVARTVLLHRQREFDKGMAYSRLHQALGAGIIGADGATYRSQRRTIQPHFRRETIDAHAAEVGRIVDRTCERWRPDHPIELLGEMTRFTAHSLACTLLHVDASPQLDALVGSLHDVLIPFKKLHRAILPFPGLVDAMPLPSNLRYRRARRELDRILLGWIDERSRLPAAERPDDLLSALVAEDDSDDPRETARARLATIFVAGVETTSFTLAAVFCALAWNPPEEEKLLRELDAERHDASPSAETLERLPRLADVVRETLRLYAPVASVSRRPVRPLELGGFLVTPDCSISVSPRLLHLDPRHFSDPLRFVPDRWRSDEAGMANPDAFLPFGLGSRRCIGEGFAMLEMKIAVARILRRWHLDVAPQSRLDFDGAVTFGDQVELRAIPTRREAPARE